MEMTTTRTQPIINVNGLQMKKQEDILAIEEPLQIQLQLHTASGRMNKNIAVTMCTPGDDAALATGFLFTEGIISNKEQIENIIHNNNDENRIQIILKEGVIPSLQNAERNFYSCHCSFLY